MHPDNILLIWLNLYCHLDICLSQLIPYVRETYSSGDIAHRPMGQAWDDTQKVCRPQSFGNASLAQALPGSKRQHLKYDWADVSQASMLDSRQLYTEVPTAKPFG